jgi:hypothetical protein
VVTNTCRPTKILELILINADNIVVEVYMSRINTCRVTKGEQETHKKTVAHLLKMERLMHGIQLSKEQLILKINK